MNKTFIAKEQRSYMSEGDHNVTITGAEFRAYEHGEEAVFVTCENEKKESHEQAFPLTAFKKYDDEGPKAKFPDSLTAAERASGNFVEEMNEQGVGLKHALQIKAYNAKTQKWEDCTPTRIVSKKKSDAAVDIFQRFAGAAGIPAGTNFAVEDLIGKSLTITIDAKEVPGKGEFRKITSFKALAEELI